MQRIVWWLAAVGAALIAALAVANWSALNAPTVVDLLFTQVQAPLGLLMLGSALVLVLLFGVATLGQHVAALVETRRLLKEVQRLQGLADQAEASRMEALQRLIGSQFRLINERLDATFGSLGRRVEVPEEEMPLVKLQ